MKYLLDTNNVIEFLNNTFDEKAKQFLIPIIDNESILSIISKMELLGFNFKSLKEQKSVESFVTFSKLINLNEDIIYETISIRKRNKISLPDAIIAATAITNDFTLLSRNVKDFKNISKLSLIDPNKL